MFNFSVESLKRNPPEKPNMAYYWWRYVRNAKRTLQAQSYLPSDPDVARIAQQLVERGIVFDLADQFLTKEGQIALLEVSTEVLDLSRASKTQVIVAGGGTDHSKSYLVFLIPWDAEHLADSPLIKLGLDKKLLGIVSSYLGLFPQLHAIGAWLNFPTQDEAKETQLFHRDPEDAKIIKVFIYLNDVDENCGPFTYIPGTHPFGSAAAKRPEHMSGIRISDEDMNAVLPREAWLQCTGPANTMILADTVGYHRGQKPKNRNRILITFTYTSGKPFKGKARRFNIKGHPSWIMDEIQRFALY